MRGEVPKQNGTGAVVGTADKSIGCVSSYLHVKTHAFLQVIHVPFDIRPPKTTGSDSAMR